MGRIIRIKNNLDINAPYTYLSSSLSAGGTTIPIRNPNAFEASWAIQIGKTNEELAEILVLGTASPSGTALNTTGTAKYNHPTDTPVYAIKYDQIKIYRNTSGTSTAATILGTVDIQPDNVYTQYDDTSGASSYYYRASYINSVLGTTSETEQSAWLGGSGFSFYSRGKLRERVKKKLYDDGYIKDDDTINDWLNEWLETMNNSAVKVNEDFSLGSTNISHGTDGFATITSDDFIDVRRVWFTTDGNSYYEGARIESNEYMPSDIFNSTMPRFYYHSDSVIAKLPNGEAGTASVLYYKRQPVMDNDDDGLPITMRSYTNSFVNYALGQAYMLDQKTDIGRDFLTLANNDLSNFQSNITPRGKTGPKFIQFTNSTSGEDFMPDCWWNFY